MVLAKHHECTYLIKARLPTSRLLFREVIESFLCEIKGILVNRFQTLQE